MKKIDVRLEKIFAFSNKDYMHTCLVYVNDFSKAKKFFESKKIEVLKEYKFLNLIAIKSNQDTIFSLEYMPFIDYVAESSRVMALTSVARKILGADNLDFGGENVTVAVIDTGISTHFDFVLGHNRIIKFVDLINKKKLSYDDNGHGTFVAGVLGGSGLMSFKKFRGFAPGCNIVSIKALDKNGEANAMVILDAMEWVYDNRKKYNIKVVCMSFGSEPIGYNDPIMKGAEKLWSNGIVVVAAAGNSGPKFRTIKSPGISSKIITVGGFNDNRKNDKYEENYFEIADFSSRGPALSGIKPDLVAPSVDIISCDKNNGYIKLSGTSVATPMIAGICALIIQKYPNFNPDQIKKLLLKCCKSICHNYNLEGMGYPKIT